VETKAEFKAGERGHLLPRDEIGLKGSLSLKQSRDWRCWELNIERPKQASLKSWRNPHYGRLRRQPDGPCGKEVYPSAGRTHPE